MASAADSSKVCSTLKDRTDKNNLVTPYCFHRVLKMITLCLAAVINHKHQSVFTIFLSYCAFEQILPQPHTQKLTKTGIQWKWILGIVNAPSQKYVETAGAETALTYFWLFTWFAWVATQILWVTTKSRRSWPNLVGFDSRELCPASRLIKALMSLYTINWASGRFWHGGFIFRW